MTNELQGKPQETVGSGAMVRLRWQYSRNQLRHWVTDGELYRGGEPHQSGCELFEIKTSRHASTIRQPSDMYRLLHKGKIVDMHQKVKVLKATAERIAAKQANADFRHPAA